MKLDPECLQQGQDYLILVRPEGFSPQWCVAMWDAFDGPGEFSCSDRWGHCYGIGEVDAVYKLPNTD